MIIGGEIMETSKNIILGALRNVELLEWKEWRWNKIYSNLLNLIKKKN
jgi:hypothetical protein